MKIKDIITENVDMSFWDTIDADYNPHHLEYIKQQERRQNLINKKFPGTAIFKKPVRKSEKSFSNIPPKDNPKSAGYIGMIDANIRAGHITNDQGKKLTNAD